MIIVGGGVAALEAVLALADLAPDHTDVTVIAPNSDFAYRPLAVREPFAYGAARRYPLAPIVGDAGARLVSDELAWVDPVKQRSTPKVASRSSTTRCCWRSGRRPFGATRTR